MARSSNWFSHLEGIVRTRLELEGTIASLAYETLAEEAAVASCGSGCRTRCLRMSLTAFGTYLFLSSCINLTLNAGWVLETLSTVHHLLCDARPIEEVRVCDHVSVSTPTLPDYQYIS